MNRFHKAESLQLIFSGTDFFEKLSGIIDSAEKEIHLQTYIFAEDGTGKSIAEKLKQAAKKGVKVFVLADAFGSNELSKNFIREMQEAGINFRLFSPLFSSESIYLGRRLHHKAIVGDSRIALVGGLNIADKYRGTDGELPWLDYAVLLEGTICAYLSALCERIFRRKNIPVQAGINDSAAAGEHYLRFRRNDWARRKNEIHHSYREALAGAQRSIVIMASYFLPGYHFRKLINRASRRGVQIKIILAGKSDVPWIKSAEKYLYHFLLDKGVHIYEWPGSVLHGKVAVTDNEWMTIGSYNINHLSHYLSIELNVDIKDPEFIAAFNRHLGETISSKCIEIDPGKIPSTVWERFKYSFAYHFYRLLIRLFLPRRKGWPEKGKKQIRTGERTAAAP